MKKLLLLAVSLLGMASAQAQTITAEDVIALPGQSGTISVDLATNGESGIRDAQFSFVVPTGLTLGTPGVGDATEEAGGEGSYTVAISDGETLGNGTKYTVVVYSTDANNFNDGAILNIPVSVPADYSGTYWDETTAYDLNGIAYTVENATETAVAADTYKFEVGLLGDVNKSGDVAFADAGLIFQYMEAGTTPASLGNFSVICDLNGDGSFSFADAGLVFDIIEGSASSSVKEEVEWNAPYEGEFDWAD